jgi:hypothetical protein
LKKKELPRLKFAGFNIDPSTLVLGDFLPKKKDGKVKRARSFLVRGGLLALSLFFEY